MENNNLYRILNEEKTIKVADKTKKEMCCIIGFMIVLLFSQKGNAQFVNKEELKVIKGTLVSVKMDYFNDVNGHFVNDGELYIFNNWTNNGLVTFTGSENGKTLFTGEQQQSIEGLNPSDFQNVVFNNISSDSNIPFDLKSIITIGKNSQFENGIINGLDNKAKVVFNQNANHTNAGNQSFVDGIVEKKGSSNFEFPVGNGKNLVYRPSLSGATSTTNSYISQYFLQTTPNLAGNKDKDILLINNAEYWQVDQNGGTEKIVLGLTLNDATTPSEFFNLKKDQQLAIVRWDAVNNIWVNEKGAAEDSGSALYSQLLMGKVSVNGYGIFTIAIVNKTDSLDTLIVYNAISPNGDGYNDTFLIEGIKDYPDNEVEIYNRWGVKVYDAKGYNESDNMFTGYSDGRATIKKGEKLPTGTYFYILRYTKDGKGMEKSGYLYINNQ